MLMMNERPRLKIPKEILDEINKATRSYRSSLDAMAKAVSRHKQLVDQCAVFTDTPDQYPPAVRPFKSCEATIELDEVWSQAASQSFEFVVQIPLGTSRREEKQNPPYFAKKMEQNPGGSVFFLAAPILISVN